MNPNVVRIASHIDAKGMWFCLPPRLFARFAFVSLRVLLWNLNVVETFRFQYGSIVSVCSHLLDYSHINASSCVNFLFCWRRFLFVRCCHCFIHQIEPTNTHIGYHICLSVNQKKQHMMRKYDIFGSVLLWSLFIWYDCAAKIFLNLRHHRYFCFVPRMTPCTSFFSHAIILWSIVYLNEFEFSTTLNNLRKKFNGWFDIHSSCIGRWSQKCERKGTAMQIIMNEKRSNDKKRHRQFNERQWTFARTSPKKRSCCCLPLNGRNFYKWRKRNVHWFWLLLERTGKPMDQPSAALSNWPLRRLTFHKIKMPFLCYARQRNRKSLRVIISCIMSQWLSPWANQHKTTDEKKTRSKLISGTSKCKSRIIKWLK